MEKTIKRGFRKSVQMNKKASDLTVKEWIELIIAIIGILLIFFWFFGIFRSGINKDAESAESYFETLKEEIKKADEGKTGEFLIWENDNVYLVYFDKDVVVTDDNYDYLAFFTINSYENYICMCYFKDKEKEKDVCENCMSLKYPVRYIGKEKTWVIKKDEKVLINKTGSEYVFSREGI